MKTPRNLARTGTFELLSGKELFGELSLRGRKSYLRLHDNESLEHSLPSDGFLRGILHDQKKVSLLDCVILRAATHRGGNVEIRHATADFFPHFVMYGDRHISPTEHSVLAINFVVDDAATLFYDFHAFGSLNDARPFIDQIVQAHKDEVSKHYPSYATRIIATGPRPRIVYFTGKEEIFRN